MEPEGASPSPLNFLALRYLAALCVVFAHSFVLTGKLPLDLLAFVPALGGIAVLGVTIFFLISGYLVTQSWSQQPLWARFALKRLLRVYPALAACLVFSIFLGASVTTLPARAYWQSEELPGYLLKNLLLQNYPPLPGVFTHNPLPSVVNGSLWTISIEVSCYLGVMALGVAGALATRMRAACVLSVALVCAMLWGQYANLFGAMVVSAALPTYYAAFVCGALLFQWRTRVPSSVLAAASLLLASLALPQHPIAHVLHIALLGILVLNLARWLGHHWPERNNPVDLSYGIYLYAFPIQQALAQSFPQDSGWVNLAKTIPLCIVCAGLSWHFIEHRVALWRTAPPRSANLTATPRLT
jgi:peptidoglycan/LPS O-acetylase OafA/YrhL